MAGRFAGTTDQLSYSGTLPGSTNGATIVCWVYLSVDRNDWSTISRTSQGGTSIQYLALDATGTDSGWFSAGGSITGITFTVGSWHRLAATLIGSAGTFYTAMADGPVTVGTSATMTSGDPTELGIGGRGAGDSTEPFNGRIAGWKAWAGGILSRADIEREWSQLCPVRTAGLVAAYPRLQSGVDGRLDMSGNGRMLTAGATAISTEDDPPVPLRVTQRRIILLGTTSTTATAGVGAVTGTANAPSTAAAALAGVASGTATANAPGVALVALAGVASGTATANAPGVVLTPAAQLATVSGVASGPAVALGVPAGFGSATGTANAPGVSTGSGLTALAGVASGTATANAPSVAVVAPSLPALGTGAAGNGAVALASAPTTAPVTGAAHDAATGHAARPTVATATVTAYGPAIGGTATLTLTVADRVRAQWHTERIRPTWQTEQIMLERSVLSQEVILFGPIRYQVDGVATSPTALTVEAALTAATAGADPSSWATATWSTIVESGRTTYWAKVTIGPGSTLGAQPVGVRKGWVRITASGETPVLPAGYVEFV